MMLSTVSSSRPFGAADPWICVSAAMNSAAYRIVFMKGPLDSAGIVQSSNRTPLPHVYCSEHTHTCRVFPDGANGYASAPPDLPGQLRARGGGCALHAVRFRSNRTAACATSGGSGLGRHPP